MKRFSDRSWPVFPNKTSGRPAATFKNFGISFLYSFDSKDSTSSISLWKSMFSPINWKARVDRPKALEIFNLLTDTGENSKHVLRRKRSKVNAAPPRYFLLFFRRVRATSMTQRRVENTRVHFWTFSRVSVKHYCRFFKLFNSTFPLKMILTFDL